jgi:uncharacterized protein YcbK (DUF882 family)
MKSYFTPDELACKHCGIVRLAPVFLDKLNQLRHAVGHAMVVTSACRCPEHNKNVGGKADSFHITSSPWGGCCAADISMASWTSQRRWKFIKEAMDRGWSIGINFQLNFIHIDRRIDYAGAGWPEPVLFKY